MILFDRFDIFQLSNFIVYETWINSIKLKIENYTHLDWSYEVSIDIDGVSFLEFAIK